MSHENDSLRCDECESTQGVRTVQFRRPMKVNEWVPKKTRLCKACRAKHLGQWRYWR